jgi:hypothetical protein
MAAVAAEDLPVLADADKNTTINIPMFLTEMLWA